MLNDDHDLLSLCEVLDKLISITLENVILKLRRQLTSTGVDKNILECEIQDSEVSNLNEYFLQNKTYEYIARQISAICNADENVANKIMRNYPQSATCFQCLGIDDNIIQGFLRLRGIFFLQLMDMPDNEVADLLRYYGALEHNIEHVLSGLAKIRLNIDIIESNGSFEADTRRLIEDILRYSDDIQQDKDLSILPDNATLEEEIEKLFPDKNIVLCDPKDQHEDKLQCYGSPNARAFTGDKRAIPDTRFIMNKTREPTPPQSPYAKRHYSRQMNNQPVVSHSKQKIKSLFSLRRSKSHESNLAAKIGHVTPNKINNISSVGNTYNHSGIMAYSGIDYMPHSPGLHAVASPDTSLNSSIFEGHKFFENKSDHQDGNLKNCRRASFEIRTNKNVNSSTEMDSNFAANNYSNESTQGPMCVPASASGLMHSFESESKFYNFLFGSHCAICKNKMNWRILHCIHCK